MAQTSLTTWLKKSHTSSVNEPSSKQTLEQEQEQSRQSTQTDEAPSADESQSLSPSTKTDGLPSNVEFRRCTRDDIPRLRRLTSLLLPIPYPDSFFREIIEDEVTNSITLLAFWYDAAESSTSDKGTLVGAIRCRLLARPPGHVQPAKDGPMLYLSTLALLSPYRHHGIAMQLLDRVVRVAVRDYDITSLGAHVWESNEEGLSWYRKRGFKQVSIEPEYYRRLKPSSAVVMQKNLSTLDLVR